MATRALTGRAFEHVVGGLRVAVGAPDMADARSEVAANIGSVRVDSV